MLLDLQPLRIYRDFRLLYFGQFISAFGSMISYVAVPYQVYELTRSSFYVGLLGAIQVVPVLLLGLWGGAVADRIDRRRLLLVSEILMSAGTLGLFFNACLPRPSLLIIFIFAGFLQAVNAFHRPAMEAITQKLVGREHYGSIAALASFRFNLSMIAGPAVGGVLMSFYGTRVGFFVDFLTYFFAFLSIFLMQAAIPAEQPQTSSHWEDIRQSLDYAARRPVLIGTYVVDIVAMIFAFPTALFPAMAESWGGAKAAGALFSAMSIGALFTSVFSGWSGRIRRHGAMVVIAAFSWGISILGMGFAKALPTALFFLVCAGAADAVSAIYRSVIWNETIPNKMRGKLAGMEMISYLTGPLLGNMRAGWMAETLGISRSVWMGGAICALGVMVCAFLLPDFWRYRAPDKVPE